MASPARLRLVAQAENSEEYVSRSRWAEHYKRNFQDSFKVNSYSRTVEQAKGKGSRPKTTRPLTQDQSFDIAGEKSRLCV